MSRNEVPRIDIITRAEVMKDKVESMKKVFDTRNYLESTRIIVDIIGDIRELLTMIKKVNSADLDVPKVKTSILTVQAGAEEVLAVFKFLNSLPAKEKRTEATRKQETEYRIKGDVKIAKLRKVAKNCYSVIIKPSRNYLY